MERSVGAGGSSRARINKTFILNTVDGLKSHNRREEEEECWRHHRLERETQYHLRSESKCGKVIKPPSAADERQFWAQAKVRAMGAAQADDTRTSGPAVASIEFDPSFTSRGQAVAREVKVEERKSRKRRYSEEIEIEVENKSRSVCSHERQKKKKRSLKRKIRVKGTSVQDELEKETQVSVIPSANLDGGQDGKRESDRARRKRKKSSKKRSKDKRKK